MTDSTNTVSVVVHYVDYKSVDRTDTLEMPFVPEEGDELKIDGDVYEVVSRGYSVDSLTFSVLVDEMYGKTLTFDHEGEQ